MSGTEKKRKDEFKCINTVFGNEVTYNIAKNAQIITNWCSIESNLIENVK